MTNFIKKNIIDKFKNINIFKSVNSDNPNSPNNPDNPNSSANTDNHYKLYEPALSDSNEEGSSSSRSEEGEGDNELYEALVLNTRAIGLIYKYLLHFIILNPQYRKLCKCCITNTEKSVLQDYNYNIKVETITNDTLKLNFLINKFLDIIGEFKCSCNYKKSNFYTHKFYNYYKIYIMYNDVIPLLISYFPPTTTTNTTVTISNEISKNVGCIHNDIIKYKNYSYCRHVNKNRNNDDDVIRNNELINKIVSINEWLIENNKVVISLFNKQSYDYICLCCNGWSAINKTDKNVDKVNKDINKVYNIDFALIDIDSRIIRVILINNNLSYEIKEKFIEIMTNKTLEKYVLESVVIKLCEYVLEMLNHKYYKFGLYVLNNIKILYKNTLNMIEHILNIVINSTEIDITLQVEYIKVIYKLYDLSTINPINPVTTITTVKDDIINKLVSISRGDIIISHFKNNYNFLVHCDDYNERKYIIKIVKKCIIYKKPILLDYVLTLLNKINKIDKINKINKIDKGKSNKVNINHYQHYFQTIYNECSKIPNFCDYKYSLLLDVICTKNKTNINKMYNDSYINTIKNEDIGYLEFCIKNNYIYSAKVLIKNNINLQSSLCRCIDNKNYIIASYILKSNNIYILNNIVDAITSLFNKITDEIILLKFVDKFVYIINNNKLKDYVSTLVYKVIDSKIIQYYNKIVFINKMINIINPFEQKEPLILYTITNNNGKGMYEITYLLLMQLFIDNKIKIQNEDSKDIKEIVFSNINNYSYYDANINFNVIPVILQYIKQNYTDIDYSKFIEFNIYNNENNMYNVITIIIYFSIFIVYNSLITNNSINDGCIKGIGGIEGNEGIGDIGGIGGNNIKGESTMYIEIEDYESNRALLETEPEPEPKIKVVNKNNNMFIDSKTILFTEKTNISSDIEDNEIYTFS